MALGKTQDELLDNVSSKDISEWIAFEKLEPFGFHPMQYLLAQIISMVYSSIPKKKGIKTLNITDFMLGDYDYLFEKEKKRSSVSRIHEMKEKMLMAFGASSDPEVRKAHKRMRGSKKDRLARRRKKK